MSGGSHLFGFLAVLLALAPELMGQPMEDPVVAPQGEEESEPDSGAGRRRDDKKLDVFTIGEVVVTHRRSSNVEQAATTTVVRGDEIAARGQKTLDEALELTPGVQLYTHTKGHRRLRLRGFDQDKVLILVDGIPISDVFATGVDISTVPVVNVSKVVVNRGVSSALYGADGAIGSINVVTRRPRKLFARAGAEYGLYHNATYNLAHGMPLGDFYYWVNGTIQTSGGFAPSASLDAAERRRWFDKVIRYDLYGHEYDDLRFPAREQYLEDDGKWNHHHLDRYSVAAKAGHRFGDLEVGLSGGFHLQEGRTNTYQPNCISDYNLAEKKWRLNRRPWFGDEVSSTKDFALRNRSYVYPSAWRLTASPYLQGKWGDFQLRMSGFYSLSRTTQEGYASNDHEFVKDQAAVFTSRRDDPWEPFVDLKSYAISGVRLIPSWRFSHFHRLTGVVFWRYDTLYQQDQALSAESAPTIFDLMGSKPYPVRDLGAHYLTVAVEDELKLFDRLKLAAGISYDAQFISRFRTRSGMDFGDMYVVRDTSLLAGNRDSFNPVAGAVLDVVPRVLRLRASGSIKARFPNLNEYAKITDESLDQDLKPERSYNANGGLEFFFLDKRLSLRGDYFLSLIDDRIARISRDDPPVNIERVAVQGTETIFTAALGRLWGVVELSGSLGYTFVHARNHDDSQEDQVNKGDFVESIPEHQVTADLRLGFVTGTAVSLWGRYLHGARIYVMARAPEEFAPYSTDFFTTAELHNPIMLNARLAQEFLDHFEVYVLPRNLLDDYDLDPFNPGPGRMVFAGASARW